MQKTIYSLPALRELLEAAKRRYLEFLSAIEDPRAGRGKLDKLSQPVEREGRRYAGFNLFDRDDENLLCAIVRSEFNISGLQNKRSAVICPTSAAARFHACSSSSEPMVCSKRSGIRTSTTSPCSAKRLSPPH